MTGLHTFKIHAPLNQREAFVEMDGERMKGVRRVEFAFAAGPLTEVQLTVIGEVFISGEFRDDEIISAKHTYPPSGGLRIRTRRAVARAFPEMSADQVKAIADKIMHDIESTR